MWTDGLLTSVPFFVVGRLSRHPLSSRNALIRDLVLALMSSILNQEEQILALEEQVFSLSEQRTIQRPTDLALLIRFPTSSLVFPATALHSAQHVLSSVQRLLHPAKSELTCVSRLAPEDPLYA